MSFFLGNGVKKLPDEVVVSGPKTLDEPLGHGVQKRCLVNLIRNTYDFSCDDLVSTAENTASITTHLRQLQQQLQSVPFCQLCWPSRQMFQSSP
jgi:hypothetical protein